MRHPDYILDAASGTLDFSQPIALMLLGILNFIESDDEAQAIIDRLVDAVPTGSYLAIAHPTNEVNTEAANEARRLWNESATPPLTFRGKAQLHALLERLELLEPGVVSCSR